VKTLLSVFLAVSIGVVSVAGQSVRPLSLLISATDATGTPVRDLTKENLTILDNGSPASVVDLRPVDNAPLSLGIVLLASKTNFAKEQAAAIELVNKLVRNENDHVFVITAGGDKTWAQIKLEWQNDRDAIAKNINGLDKSTGLPDAFNYDWSTYSGDTATSTASWSIETQQGKGTSVFDIALSMMMNDRRPARRVLVMFRSPWAHAPGMSQRNRDYTDREHARLIAAAQQLRVSIYTVGFDEVPRSTNAQLGNIGNNYGANMMGDITRERDRQTDLQKDRMYNGGKANVERLTEGTGGSAWWKDDHNFRDSVAGIVNQINAQYMVSFVPASNAPGAHVLKVSSARIPHLQAPTGFAMAAPAAAQGK